MTNVNDAVREDVGTVEGALDAVRHIEISAVEVDDALVELNGLEVLPERAEDLVRAFRDEAEALGRHVHDFFGKVLREFVAVIGTSDRNVA